MSRSHTADATESPRRARGERTRRRLLDAGKLVFAERGYYAARVDDVVKEADTSHGTFYLYFSNKEELFGALVGEVAEQMCELAGDLPELRGDDARSQLRAWLARFADLHGEYGSVIRAWSDAEIAGGDLGTLGNETLSAFTHRIEARIATTAPPQIDPAAAALAVIAMVERSLFYVASDQTGVPLATMLDTLAALIIAGTNGAE